MSASPALLPPGSARPPCAVSGCPVCPGGESMRGWSATARSGHTKGLRWSRSSPTLCTEPRTMTMMWPSCGSAPHCTSQVRLRRGAVPGGWEPRGFLRPLHAVNPTMVTSFGGCHGLWHHGDLGLHQLFHMLFWGQRVWPFSWLGGRWDLPRGPQKSFPVAPSPAGCSTQFPGWCQVPARLGWIIVNYIVTGLLMWP